MLQCSSAGRRGAERVADVDTRQKTDGCCTIQRETCSRKPTPSSVAAKSPFQQFGNMLLPSPHKTTPWVPRKEPLLSHQTNEQPSIDLNSGQTYVMSVKRNKNLPAKLYSVINMGGGDSRRRPTFFMKKIGLLLKLGPIKKTSIICAHKTPLAIEGGLANKGCAQKPLQMAGEEGRSCASFPGPVGNARRAAQGGRRQAEEG